jgi:DNA-directed RNA polymerase specialized sigma24 family protein
MIVVVHDEGSEGAVKRDDPRATDRSLLPSIASSPTSISGWRERSSSSSMTLSKLRISPRRPSGTQPKASSATGAAPDPIDAADDRDELTRLLVALPANQREALALVEWLGMSAEDAARTLGIALVSVRVRLSRAKAALRVEHEATGDER